MGLLPRQRASARGGKTHEPDDRPGAYRVEVDTEPRHFPPGRAFSFWSAVQYIFVLSLLLWWLPYNIGAMVAGYVGGRRAGSHWKAVLAALVPVVVLAAAQWLAVHGIGVGVFEYLAALPRVIADAFAAALPPAKPYIDFVAEYFATFVLALEATLGMQANGYLIVVVFAYVGGIVGEQTRREMGEEIPSTSVRIVQPVVERLRAPLALDRWPFVRALRRAEPEATTLRGANRRAPARGPHRRAPWRFTEFRRVEAEAERHSQPAPAPVRGKREVPEPRPIPHLDPGRDRDRDLATQRFVERALRAYERPHRRPL